MSAHSTPLKIAIAGLGYVGLSMAALLSRQHHVTTLVVIPKKIELVNQRRSPIYDPELHDWLHTHRLDSPAALSKEEAYAGTDHDTSGQGQEAGR